MGDRLPAGQERSEAECQLAGIETSPVSPMPPGLLNILTEEEVLDLLAYLLSGGDAEDGMFR